MTADHVPEPSVDVTTAARLLGVPTERILVMVDEDLLHPLPGHDSPVFDATEVHALRNLGG